MRKGRIGESANRRPPHNRRARSVQWWSLAGSVAGIGATPNSKSLIPSPHYIFSTSLLRHDSDSPIPRFTVSPQLFLFAFFIFNFAWVAHATSITSNGTGNWSAAGTGNPTQVPTSSDYVTIRAGDTVYVDANAATAIITTENGRNLERTLEGNGVWVLLAGERLAGSGLGQLKNPLFEFLERRDKTKEIKAQKSLEGALSREFMANNRKVGHPHPGTVDFRKDRKSVV